LPSSICFLRALISTGTYDGLHVTRQRGKDASTNSLQVISG
jgi:hypothetical protein